LDLLSRKVGTYQIIWFQILLGSNFATFNGYKVYFRIIRFSGNGNT